MEISTEFLVLIPLIIGVVQAAKLGFKLDSRFLPLVALALGVVGAMFLGGVSVASGLQGLIAGLSASGLYSGVKATSGK